MGALVTGRRSGRLFLALAAGLSVVVAGVMPVVHHARGAQAVALAIGTAMVLVFPLLPLAPAVIRGIPAIGRSLPIRLASAAFLVGCGAIVASWPDLDLAPGALVAVALALVAVGRGLLAVLTPPYRRWLEGLRTADRHRVLRTVLSASAWWPVVLIAVPMYWINSRNRYAGLYDASLLILLTEAVVAVLALTVVTGWVLVPAGRWMPARMGGVALLGAVGGALLGCWAAPEVGLARPAYEAIAGAGAALGLGLAALGLALVGTGGNEDLATLEAALDERDGGGPVRLRTRRLFRAMAVARVPAIAQAVEATQPPFHKSFLMLRVETNRAKTRTERVVFEAYGVNDERPAGDRTPLPTTPSPTAAQQPERGAFLIERLTIELP